MVTHIPDRKDVIIHLDILTPCADKDRLYGLAIRRAAEVIGITSMFNDADNEGGDKGKRPEGALRGLATLASMGITIVACTFIGLFLGIYIDKYLGSSPWFTLILLFFGIAAGFKNIYMAAKKNGL